MNATRKSIQSGRGLRGDRRARPVSGDSKNFSAKRGQANSRNYYRTLNAPIEPKVELNEIPRQNFVIAEFRHQACFIKTVSTHRVAPLLHFLLARHHDVQSNFFNLNLHHATDIRFRAASALRTILQRLRHRAPLESFELTFLCFRARAAARGAE